MEIETLGYSSHFQNLDTFSTVDIYYRVNSWYIICSIPKINKFYLFGFSSFYKDHFFFSDFVGNCLTLTL